MTTATIITHCAETISCKLFCKKARIPAPLPALTKTFAALQGASILGGNASKANADGFSYWAAEPKEVFEFRAADDRPFEKLQNALEKYTIKRTGRACLPKGMPAGGWIGYFGYELGSYIEKLPETTIDDLRMPLVRLCFYDRLIAYDHKSGQFWLVALELPDDIGGPEKKLARLEMLLERAADTVIEQPPPADMDNIDFARTRCNITRDYYFDALKKIKRYITDGEVYQINFSQRFECGFGARPIELFAWQNLYNPSPYSAYIDAGDFQIVSASPEMFITIEDDVISTKPIKGTRRRFRETSEAAKQFNAKNFGELVNSEKEQAELNMIIDLERNDVARICAPGTRKVTQPRTIETYPTVFHAVATVAGRLRENTTFCDILKAMFPGGSITGAPKLRAMEIIDETEPTERGVYTGGIGYIGLDGSACLNIAIRTIIIKNKTAYVQTGGGIVADSDPDAEWDETLTKARALLAGIKVVAHRA